MSGGTGQGGDSFRRVMPGEPLRPDARAWNACLDAAEEAAKSRASRGRTPRDVRSSGLVLVRNDSGEACDLFDVLGIDGPLIIPENNEEEFADRVVMSGVTATLPDHLGRFVILLEPLAAGQEGGEGDVGLACASGVCPAKLNVTNENHRFADIDHEEGVGFLTTRPSGAATILWKESGTGAGKWALVRLGSSGGTADNPKVLGPSDPAQLTDATDEWDITEAEYDGVQFCPYRSVYDESTKLFLGFRRILTHDSSGRLIHVGPEAQYTAATATVCTAQGS
ncbi:MAG: hypothetical protein JXL80_17585 [Planctomycetes bacterium]|nr:hypothetical protein [Planctomycetota bacterium]